MKELIHKNQEPHKIIMRKGLGQWVVALIAIFLALAIIYAMYLTGTGAIGEIAQSIFGQS